MSQSNIITGQYVSISQTPASVWERVAARLIDFVAVVVYTVAVTYFYGRVVQELDLGVRWEVVIVFCLYVPTLFYDLLWEVLSGGRSLGKLLVGLRVVMADGSQPGLGSYFMRWLLFLVEGPTMGCVGFIPMLVSRNAQRFGDMAAGTMVIKLSKYHSYDVNLNEYAYLTDDYRPSFPQAAELSARQADVISRTLEPLTANRGIHIAVLAAKVKALLGVESHMTDERFLFTVLHDYQYFDLNGV